jgi:hypothetical protein
MASLSYDYSLSNNTVADATHVMSNFNKVKTFVEASTVQVDGSVQAGTAAIANGAVTFDKLVNSVPRGIVAGKNKITSDSSVVTTTSPGIWSISFNAIAGRTYKVTFISRFSSTDFSDIWQLSLADSGNVPIQDIYVGGAAFGAADVRSTFLFNPASTNTVVFYIRLGAIGSPAGSAKTVATALSPTWFYVEDIGAI